MDQLAKLRRNGWVMMLCGIVVVAYKLLSGTFTDMLQQLKTSTSISPVLFVLCILLEFLTAIVCIYAGFLGFQRYGKVEEVRRSVKFSYIVIGLIALDEVILAIALRRVDFNNIITLLIYLIIPGYYIFNAKTILRDE